MTDERGVLSAADRQRVLEAAITELMAKTAGSFTIEGVARRSGLDLTAVKQVWPNTPSLFTATLDAFTGRNTPVPDTGTLRGDLLAYAAAYAGMVNSPAGHRMLHAMMITPRDWDFTNARGAYLQDRRRSVTVMVRRGIDRGECLAETDAERLIDMLGAGLAYIVLFYGRPVTEDDCRSVVDVLLNGIAGNR